MQKTKYVHRLLALLVAAFMAVCCLPLAAFAANPTQTVGINYWDIENKTQVIEGSVTVDADATNVNTSKLTDIPTGYELVTTGDIQINGGYIYVEVKPIPKVVVNVRFMDGDTFVAGGDYTVPAGSQNYSVLEQYVPEGYKMEVSGDFAATEGGKLEVPVSKISTDVIVSVQFKDGDTVVAGGDYFVPAGVQNYSVLEQYVPEGYKMNVSGDFTVTAGGKLEVPVSKISTDVIMNIRFMDGETFVAGGDYSVPEGVQNYTVLNQYVPEGYKMEVSGDFTATEGGKLEVSVSKISTNVIMNIRFMDGETFVAGGDYSVPEGVQNYTVLNQYVPEGYKMDVSGDFTATEGGKLEVPVSKTSADIIMNIRFMDGDTVVAGGDYFVPEGVQNYTVLNQYVPEGYKMDVSGDFTAAEGAQLDVPISKSSADIIMNIRFMDGETFVAGGDYFVAEGVQNYSVLEQYLPEGYKMEVSGDFMAAEGAQLDVPVSKINTDIIMNIRFMDGETFVAGGDYFVPEGVQNYTVLNQYMPEGYEMDVAGDFMAKAGASMEVPVHKVVAENPTSGSTGNTGNSSSSSSNTTTVSSDSSDSDVVKASTPADNSAKIIPQTGLSIESPVLLGIMMVSALVAAAAYLFVIRKQLN